MLWDRLLSRSSESPPVDARCFDMYKQHGSGRFGAACILDHESDQMDWLIAPVSATLTGSQARHHLSILFFFWELRVSQCDAP